MLELGLKTLLSYLIGALNGSLLLGKLSGGKDVRKVGSGNAGGTNALRAFGWRFALGVMLIDVGKGVLCVWLLPDLVLPLAVTEAAADRQWIGLACAGAAVVGHCYPVWFSFAGGKGAATAVGSVAALAPMLLLPGLSVWLLVVMFTGFVGLGTMLAFAVLPVAVLIGGLAGREALFVFLLALAVFIVYTHRGNIARMVRHEEHRMTKLMLLRRGS